MGSGRRRPPPFKRRKLSSLPYSGGQRFTQRFPPPAAFPRARSRLLGAGGTDAGQPAGVKGCLHTTPLDPRAPFSPFTRDAAPQTHLRNRARSPPHHSAGSEDAETESHPRKGLSTWESAQTLPRRPKAAARPGPSTAAPFSNLNDAASPPMASLEPTDVTDESPGRSRSGARACASRRPRKTSRRKEEPCQGGVARRKQRPTIEQLL